MQRNVLKNYKMCIVHIVDTSEKMPAPKMNRQESELLYSNTAIKVKLFYQFISNRIVHIQQNQVMHLEMQVNLPPTMKLIFNEMNWFVQYFNLMWWYEFLLDSFFFLLLQIDIDQLLKSLYVANEVNSFIIIILTFQYFIKYFHYTFRITMLSNSMNRIKKRYQNILLNSKQKCQSIQNNCQNIIE